MIGSTDRDAALLRLGNVHITGRYREQEVFDLIASRRAHLAFLPSECPESYMYTLSIAMRQDCSSFASISAPQAERVRNWGWGRPIEPELSPRRSTTS